MSKRVSLTDIALETGFSVSAVSLALRDAGHLPAVTRHKIKESARRLGYFPNPLLASLASKRFRPAETEGTPLAYIHRREKAPIYSIFPDDFRRLQDYGQRLGFRLQHFDVGDFRDGAHATSVLYSRGIQGIILSPLVQPDLLPRMDWTRFSVVGWGEIMPAAPDATPLLLFRANVDHFNSVLQAWDQTWKRGYRRIGIALFNLRPGSTDDLLRWGAAQACLRKLPSRQRVPTFVPEGPPHTETFVGDFKEWTRRYRPEAVIGFNAIFLSELRKQGLKVPGDIGFVNLHTSGRPENSDGETLVQSGIKDLRLKSMMATIDLLDQQIRHHQCGLAQEPRIQMIQPDWVDGETLPVKTSTRASGRI